MAALVLALVALAVALNARGGLDPETARSALDALLIVVAIPVVWWLIRPRRPLWLRDADWGD